ncbi:MAG: alpha/beta hydrolase [Pseudomonadota bacterium]
MFYGTDRARKDTADRVAYDWKRARRLEVGRAMVSIPKNHVEPRVERPWALKIPYTNIKLYEASEDPEKHFTMQEIKSLTQEEFLALIKARIAKSTKFEKHALIFIHGYQTRFDNAVYRTAQIAFDLIFDGAPFLYSWPSGGTLQGYTYDRESAAQAETYLKAFLDLVVKETGAEKVSVIAHSMGNQPLLRVLQDFKRTMPEGLKLSQLILAAPDVDRDNFKNIVTSINDVAKGITLYTAANDQALMLSQRVNGGEPRAGQVPVSGPIIVDGVDTIDATAASTDTLGINHAGYAENIKLLRDIGRLIETGERPPLKRAPDLEVVTIDAGVYWRFPAAQ